MHKFLIRVAVAGLVLIGTAQAGGWNVAADTSSVGFSAQEKGEQFDGKFNTFSATIAFDPAAFASGRIVGTVATNSAETGDYDRDSTLVEPEWFDPDNYPEAKFESESIEKKAGGMYVAHGNLMLKGTTKPVDLTFKFDQKGNTATFDGRMTVDRFDFNVGQGWNDTYMAGKDVEVHIMLDLER